MWQEIQSQKGAERTPDIQTSIKNLQLWDLWRNIQPEKHFDMKTQAMEKKLVYHVEDVEKSFQIMFSSFQVNAINFDYVI